MKYLILSLFMLILTCTLAAQDAHYWTEQYGTKSMLLSNSVVGEVEDLGAVFYNPARLGLIENPAFVISGKVYELSKTSIKNPTGNDKEPTKQNNSFGGAPSLVAGTFSVKGWDKHHFAYAFLTRRRMTTNLSGITDGYGDLSNILPGEEYFSGEINATKSFKEEWIGGSWAYKPGDKFSVGVTGFLNTRNQNATGLTQLQTYNNTDVIIYQNNKNYSFQNVGILFKIGLAAHLDKVNLGLTITTPTIGLSGSGTFRYEQYLTGGEGVIDPIYVRNLQDGVKSVYKTPFAIAIGGGVKLWGGTLMGSAEYFHKIDYYNIMSGETFVGQSTDLSISPYVYDQLNSVINFGVGYNFVFSKRINGYLSYSTDHSATLEGNKNWDDSSMDIKASTFVSDINHFGGGVVMNFKRADITLGATFATAKYTIPQPIDFPDGDNGSITDPDAYSQVNWDRWRFIVGISVPFVDDIAKRWEEKLFSGEKKSKEKTKKEK